VRLYSLKNLIQQSRSSKSNTTLGWTINARLSWNQKAHYQVHNSVPASDASSPQPHNPLKLLFNFSTIYPSTSVYQVAFPSRFGIRISHAFLTSPIRVTLPSHLNVLYEIRLQKHGRAMATRSLYRPMTTINISIFRTQPVNLQTEFPSIARAMTR